MSKKALLEIHKNSLALGGEPFYLASGDMHYFRFFKDGWRRRLKLMKDFGLTAVQTYVPWNMHEPEEGEFRFGGNLDIGEFLRTCDEVGLKVLFRPSPYICSEWDFGGLPYWLLKKDGIGIRTYEPIYMECLKNYYERLTKEFVPYLSTNGGPIIAVAVENEYGSFGDDRRYIAEVGNLLRELGVDVPLYTANGFEPFKLLTGSRPEYWTTIDLHELTEEARSSIMGYQSDKPIMIGEFWAGRSQQWGGCFKRQTAEDVAKLYKSIIDQGAYVNFYMFCGGTNFGFHNGALEGRYGADLPGAPNRYIPFATSYDVDAPVTEYGYPTEKYFACKRVLREYLEAQGIPFTGSDDDAAPKCETQSIDSVKLTKAADLLDNAEVLAKGIRKSGMPLTFETMNQDYGFMLYSTDIEYTDDAERLIRINGLHDRAMIFGNGKYLGCMMRDRKSEDIRFTVPNGGLRLDIFVENMGRVNYGNAMLNENKGICGFVKIEVLNEDGSIYPWNYTVKTSWTNISLPFDNLDKTDFSKTPKPGRPIIFEGSFSAKSGVDTFFNPGSGVKGFVEINGFNIGRYWSVGPQGTLYVPGELLKENNIIRIVELHPKGDEMSVGFDSEPSLDTIEETCDLQVSVVG
ncbi:MAG: beta-galactosidase [Monoglobaceae bacterium]